MKPKAQRVETGSSGRIIDRSNSSRTLTLRDLSVTPVKASRLLQPNLLNYYVSQSPRGHAGYNIYI